MSGTIQMHMDRYTIRYMRNRARLFAVVLAVLVLPVAGLFWTTASHGTNPQLQPDGRFEYARALYRQHRWSGAYGRFAELADQGHADAACIALFMVQQGSGLFESDWSATQSQIQLWSRISRCRTENFTADGGD